MTLPWPMPRLALAALREPETPADFAACHDLDLDLVVAFGSAVAGSAEPRDLDLAVRSRTSLDVPGLLQDV